MASGSSLDLGDFNGSYEIVAIPGKGRGVLATCDIKPGQLILAEKAVSAVHAKDLDSYVLQTNWITKMMSTTSQVSDLILILRSSS